MKTEDELKLYKDVALISGDIIFRYDILKVILPYSADRRNFQNTVMQLMCTAPGANMPMKHIMK